MRGFLVALLLALLVAPALAETSPLIIDRARSDRTEPKPGHRQHQLAQPKPVNRLAQVTPFVLTGVRIEGTSLAPAVLGDATKAFIGQTVDAKAIGEIANKVSAAYASGGDVALYTVTVPDQDFAGGVLRLIVTEGYIEHVDVNGDVEGDVSRVVSLAGKLTVERPLRRSTLERYLSLIRDLPGLTVDAQLLAGSAAGAVKLSLTLKQKDHALALSFNDGGSSLLGRFQVQADLTLYNLLREGEETTLSLGTSTIVSRYQYFALSHGEALDDEGTRAGASYGYLHTRVPSFALDGTAQTAQVYISHPVIRSYDENLSLVASLDSIDSSNALLGQLLANEHVRAFRLSAGYSLTDPDWLLSLGASANFGLDILGAGVGDPLAADSDFKKIVLQGRYNHLLGADWVVRLHLVSQLASDRLPVSELYALGGAEFGRAFLSASALGDSAVAGSLEVGFAPKVLPSWLTGTEFFVFADDGMTWYRARHAAAAIDFDLASAGAGIRIPVGAKTRLELQAADALRADAPGTRAGEWRFLFALTYGD
ncbi:MAG TPA: ShlB/FhaC/HecB family hemolysin secretion/activation protein [Rhizomicrobium sp.]|nr:ShlB/FhaC/HecB family hemolysin secretion/activation protein [Rhizomicrobium sp.]